MSSGADDQSLFIFRTELRNLRRGAVEAEVDHDVALADDGFEIVALIDLADDFQFRNVFGAGNKRLAHATFGSSDNDSGAHSTSDRRDRPTARPQAAFTKVSLFSCMPAISSL